MDKSLLREVLKQTSNRTAVATITDLGSGRQHVITKDGAGTHPKFAAELEDCFRTDRSRLVENDEGKSFIQVYNPPLRLIIIGAGHITQHLVRLAGPLNYDVIVIDPRTGFLTPERFPNTNCITEWPQDTLPKLKLDQRTAIAVISHDPKIDDPAFVLALNSDAFYIGALGSTRTHAKRVERLKALGIDDASISRIFAPIGSDIGAIGSAEIALSTMSQITAVLRGKTQPSKRA